MYILKGLCGLHYKLNFSTDIDDCSPGVCANGGTCVDGIDLYTCSCAAGYTGPNCNTSKYCLQKIVCVVCVCAVCVRARKRA